MKVVAIINDKMTASPSVTQKDIVTSYRLSQMVATGD